MNGQNAAEIARARQLVRDGRTEDAIALLTGLLRQAPHDVNLLLALGAIGHSAGLLDEAERAYRSVLESRPNTVEAVVGIANILVDRGTPDPAIRILHRIHAMAPRLLQPALALSAALLAGDRTQQALGLCDRLLVEQPEVAQVHANRAEVLARLGRYAESLAAADRAYRILPTNPRIALNLAFALFLEGRTAEALAAYEARLDPRNATAPLRTGLELPRWSGGPRPEGRLLVAAEQGLGDEIRFGAMAWSLAGDGADLVIEAEPRLVALLRRSLPSAEVVPYDRRRSGVRPVFGYGWLSRLSRQPSAWIEAGSLPLRLGLSASAPVAPDGYLTPDPASAAGWRDRFAAIRAEGMRVVGIVWGSSRQEPARRRFYPPVEAWGPVLGVPGIRFVDLQYTESGADRALFRERFGVDIRPVDGLDKRNDLDGSAALAASLDAVVGVSSSVTALAGAVGTPVIEIMADRIWLPRAGGRDGLVGTIRFAEADVPGDWAEAMARAATILDAIPARG